MHLVRPLRQEALVAWFRLISALIIPVLEQWLCALADIGFALGVSLVFSLIKNG
jgi:hypothetical protein